MQSRTPIIVIVSFLLIAAATIVSSGCDSSSKSTDVSPGSNAEVVHQVVEAACGQCQLGLEGTGCDLAVRIDGKAYFVDGAAIDDFGDAHAADGFCNAIRSARATGKIENGRFTAESIELVE